MKVFHYVDTYLRLTETFIYNYILASSNEGRNEVYVLALATENLQHFPLPQNIHLIHVSAITTRKTFKGLLRYFLQKWQGFPYHFITIGELLTSHAPDIVHCHFGPNGIAFAAILKALRIKQRFAVSFYGYDVGYLPNTQKGYKEDLVLLWQQCSGVFCEGPFLLNKMTDLGMPLDKGLVNPIIVDPSKYPLRPAFREGERSITHFFIIGRFTEKKGIHLSLRVLGEMKRGGYNDFMITIVGDGPLKSLYDGIIEEFKITDHVKFTGLLPLEECTKLMVEHDVLLHPSMEAANKDSEGGAPTVLIEAQFIGLPVIASWHADIPFVMGYDDFLCKENNQEDLDEIIRMFIATGASELNVLVERGKQHVFLHHSKWAGGYNDNLELLTRKDIPVPSPA